MLSIEDVLKIWGQKQESNLHEDQMSPLGTGSKKILEGMIRPWNEGIKIEKMTEEAFQGLHLRNGLADTTPRSSHRPQGAAGKVDELSTNGPVIGPASGKDEDTDFREKNDVTKIKDIMFWRDRIRRDQEHAQLSTVVLM
ncbi:hypothetical protein P7K49_005652 [Saguinus oedipus]|uniref:Uncharacterized protein n=1 Tax=Saguinus oedipus TaxID=9490 RepID=A0ABQ9W3S8_SAGOE|nr:hypothetical protein P7K49_005652 [Saguinus oedipus]